MKTRFEELRDSVNEKLKEVDKELLEMLNPDTWAPPYPMYMDL